MLHGSFLGRAPHHTSGRLGILWRHDTCCWIHRVAHHGKERQRWEINYRGHHTEHTSWDPVSWESGLHVVRHLNRASRCGIRQISCICYKSERWTGGTYDGQQPTTSCCAWAVTSPWRAFTCYGQLISRTQKCWSQRQGSSHRSPRASS